MTNKDKKFTKEELLSMEVALRKLQLEINASYHLAVKLGGQPFKTPEGLKSAEARDEKAFDAAMLKLMFRFILTAIGVFVAVRADVDIKEDAIEARYVNEALHRYDSLLKTLDVLKSLKAIVGDSKDGKDEECGCPFCMQEREVLKNKINKKGDSFPC